MATPSRSCSLDSPEVLDALSADLSGSRSERHHAALADINDALGMLGRSLSDYAPRLWTTPESTQHEVRRERGLYADRREQRAIADALPLDGRRLVVELSRVRSWESWGPPHISGRTLGGCVRWCALSFAVRAQCGARASEVSIAPVSAGAGCMIGSRCHALCARRHADRCKSRGRCIVR